MEDSIAFLNWALEKRVDFLDYSKEKGWRYIIWWASRPILTPDSSDSHASYKIYTEQELYESYLQSKK